jgi:hypothetical protein
MAEKSGQKRANMSQSIKVESSSTGGDPLVFTVEIDDGGGRSRHRVTLSDGTYKKLTGGRYTQEQCIEAAFRFLLERESRNEILPSFDLNVIHLYFPDFEESLPRYLVQG